MPTSKRNGNPQEKQKPAELPNRDQLLKAVAVQQKIAKAQAYATSLREKAATVTDSKEREILIKEAYDKEVEAHGNSKWAGRMQSGPWQGLAAGSGIGLGTGLGIGTVVGTLVGGLVSIPTTGLGALIGTGVGAINGPFIKLGGKNTRWDDASPEQVVDAIEAEYVAKQARPNSENELSTPAVGEQPPQSIDSAEPKVRKKPRKIEVRSQQSQTSSAEVESLSSKTATSSMVSGKKSTPQKQSQTTT